MSRSRLHRLVDDYITLRRSLGYKLEDHERQLLAFASFLQSRGMRFITTQLAVAWATHPRDTSPATASAKLGSVRTFAEYATTHDPRHETPPRNLLPYRSSRKLPYLFSAAEIQALLRAANGLRTPAFVGLTSRTLFGLLAVTGMRLGEAIGLDRDDLSADGVITVREAKFGKSREVALHPTAHGALRAYARERDRLTPRSKDCAFFVSRNGTRLWPQNLGGRFRLMLRRAGIVDRKPRRPRIHDLRHTFAVHTLCDWYRDGEDIEVRLPLLSTYLGHVSPSSTYWYLTATPELVALAARRLERKLGRLP